MNTIRNILVIVDPTAKQHPAIEKAAILAQKFSAGMELFVCDTKASRNFRRAEYAAHSGSGPLLADLKPMVETLAEPLRKRGIDVTTEAICADPLHAALLDRVKRTCAELVIKGTHDHSATLRSFITNTDWELIRGCPVPLLLVKPKPWGSMPRICAAVDPGHRDDKPVLLDHCILDVASYFAEHLHGQLHVLHAYTSTSSIQAAMGSEPPIPSVVAELVAEERAAKLRELTALVSDYRVPAGNLYLEMGGIQDVLCRLAKQLNADVMTMGAISRSAVRRIFIGSTAETILEHLPCDALVVKAPSFAELLAL